MTQLIEKGLEIKGNKQNYSTLERALLDLKQSSRTQTNPFVEQVGGISQKWEDLREPVRQLLAEEAAATPVYFGKGNRIADQALLAELIFQIEDSLEKAQHSYNNRPVAYGNYVEALGKFTVVIQEHIRRRTSIFIYSSEDYF